MANLSLPSALRIANPLYRSLPQATFHGVTDRAWEVWSKNTFKDVLYPALQKSMHLAASGHIRELIDVNHQMSQLLRGPLQKTSLISGRKLLLSLKLLNGERSLAKLVRYAQISPKESCHFAVVYATRCAAFHFPPSLCIATYLYQEAWTAFHSSKNLNFSEYIDTALHEAELIHLPSLQQLRTA